MISHVFNEDILEGVACGVVIAAPSGEILSANSAASRLLGLPRDDLVRQNLVDLLESPNSSLPFEDLLTRVVECGKTISELALSPADDTISLRATISPLRNAAGQTDKIVLTIFKKSRQERHAMPAPFCAEVLAHSPIGIALVDAREFRLLWANDTYRLFLEEPFRSNPVGVPFRELVPQSEERGVMDIFRRVAATGVPFVHSEFEHVGFARGVTYWRWALFPLVENDGTPDLRGRFVRFETNHRRPDGRMMEVDFSLKPVMNEENRVVLIVPEGRDITDRKAFERSLQESQKTFSRLFQLNPDWISLSRLEDGMFIDVNDGFSRLTGYRKEEVVGRSSVGELRIWADPQDRARLIEGLRRENDIVNLEARFKNKKGRFFIGWISGRRLEIQGETCLLAMVRDITDRKELEEELRRAKNAAEAANKAKSEFLATVSHELRTPLTVTMGMTEVALDLFPDKEICSFLQMAKHSSDSLLMLINDILDMAEMESGRLELGHFPFSVRDCLGGVVDRFSASAAQKKVDLCLEVSAEVPDYIDSDPKRVRQVLTNLVGNAVKFTHRGSVIIRVDRIEDGGRPAILFQVHDTGIGVPIEKRDRLFKAFSQVDSSSTRQFGGAGIGLAISKGLVERLGGRIWMEGEAGKGSTFFFTLPEHQYRQTSDN